MPIQGTKQGRAGRGASQGISAGGLAEWRERLADRPVIARLALVLAAVLLVVLGVQPWKPTFPYRLGQRASAGIAAVIEFERENRERTARARDRAAEEVPPVFKRDDRARARLAEDLRAALLLFAQVEDLSQLPAEAGRMFGLAGDAAVPAAAERAASFDRMRQVARSERAVADLIVDFERFMQPIERSGLVRPENLPRDLGVSGRLLVVGESGDNHSFALTEVQLPLVLAPGGSLHGRWGLFPALVPLRAEIESWLRAQSPETLFYDDAATQALRQQAHDNEPAVYDVYKAGNPLLKPAEVIDEGKLELLQAEYAQLSARESLWQRIARVFMVFLMLVVLAVLIGYYVVRNEPKLSRNTLNLGLFLGLVVATVAVARVVSFDPWRAEVAPILAAVMICAIVYNQVLATLTAFAISAIVLISTGADLGRFTLLITICCTASILLPSVPSRSTLVVVGGWSALVCFLMSWGTSLLETLPGVALLRDANLWIDSLRNCGWCLAAGFLVSGSLPFIEAAFGAVTDISLLELGDVSHPLLQELVRRAPGTYNHSITVASIGETAADSIGANGLLVRVGAYFHDIGKMLKPHYFVENAVNGENRHEHLAPAMSTLIIIGHVKDGAELAEQHNLPRPLIDFIQQHHGTTLVEYFYHEAARQAELDADHRTDADESHFRYPGPRPQTAEAAVLMIADAVEGATRTLSEPTTSRIERLVHEIVMKRLLDGQFDECDLTLSDLKTIEQSLTKSLSAMYHGRVKYPEQRTA